MKHLTLFLTALILLAGPQALSQDLKTNRTPAARKSTKRTRVLSYQQWKEKQINQAQNKIVRVFNQLQLLKTSRQKKLINKKLLRKNLQAQLQSAQSYLDFSLSLSFKDYLTIYLSQQPASSIKAAAKKLTPSEVKTLLDSYIQLVQKKPKTASR